METEIVTTKVYIYNSVEYKNLYTLRRNNKNLIFPDDVSIELLNQLGITIEEREKVIEVPSEKEKILEARKEERSNAVKEIVVEVDGMKFDGDVESQNRMSIVLQTWPDERQTIKWVMYDNNVCEVTKEQMKKALELAVEELTTFWIIPYED